MEIVSVFQSLKTAKDVVKALISLKVTGEVQAKLTEIGDHLMSAQAAALDAQAEQQTMSLRIRELEKQLIEFENWEAEKERYHLKEVTPGRFVYAIKEPVETGEPLHSICPNCYERRIRSIMQLHASGAWMECHRCGLKVPVPHDESPDDSEPVWAI